jgi:hypothetical protein
MEIQEIELTIKNSKDGVFAISLVESPAIEEDFVALSSQQIELKVIDEERRVLIGFALVPDKPILRIMNGKKFNIKFSKDTVAQSQELFMKQLNLQNWTLEHSQKTSGVSVIESWIVEDAKNDKSNMYNLGATGGEWVIMTKIDNDQVWNDVKDGKYKGFSIEGMYDGFEQLQSQTEGEKIIKELQNLINGAV